MLHAKESNAERIGERRRDEHMISDRHVHRVGSGTVVALGMGSAGGGLPALGRVAGSDATWRAFGVTPLQPPFFDMHVINDYAPSASKRSEAYAAPPRNADQL